MSTPLVSILLPIYNTAKSISSCLRSIQRQTYPHWECLIVDDGSTDTSATILSHFIATDSRFRVLRQAHQGLVPALNAGLAECRGDVIARMDGDDLMHRHRLADQVACLNAHPEISGVGCAVRCFPRTNLKAGIRTYEQWLNSLTATADVERDRYVECPIAHPTLMIRRQVLQSVGYRDMGWPEDYDLILRLLSSGYRLTNIPTRRLMWRRSTNSLSQQNPAYRIASFVACKAHFLCQDFLRDHSRYVLCGYGRTGKQIRRALTLLERQATHIVDVYPNRIGQHAGDAPIHPLSWLDTMPQHPLLVAVSGLKRRQQIRDHLSRCGYTDGTDFICVA